MDFQKMKAPYLRAVEQRSDVTVPESYVARLPMFEAGDFGVTFEKPVTIICGENGSGKSTLLELIAENCGFNSKGGSRNHAFSGDGHGFADAFLRFQWNVRMAHGFYFRAESLQALGDYLDDMSEDIGDLAFVGVGGKSLHKQSHGESFLSVLGARLGSPGIYVLDEPEAALSPMRMMQLLVMMHDAHMSGKSQLIIATHSPMLLFFPHAQVLEVKDGGLEVVDGRKTQHYRMYERFFNDPDAYYRELFAE